MTPQEDAFKTFRPFCSAVASKPSPEILSRLSELVNASNADTMEPIQEYIVFPMQVYLKTPTMPENYTIAVMDFVRDFYTKVRLTSAFVLQDLINSTLSFVMSKQEAIDEDFKLAVTQMFSAMFKNSSKDVLLALYSEEFKLPLSHVIFMVIKIHLKSYFC